LINLCKKFIYKYKKSKLMKNRLVLLAHCTESLSDLVLMAENAGLPFEVIAKDDLLFDIIRRHGAKYVVGVCCPRKIDVITPELDKDGVVYRAVAAKDGFGCFKSSGRRTIVDMLDYCEALDWLNQQGKYFSPSLDKYLAS
jgi:hypothetical protein